MDGDIQTTSVSIVKVEEVEIKEEPVEDYGQYYREARFGDLGNFYQVECNGGPVDCMVQEEEQQRNVKGCACSKELERLEARMGRLECLLELLVSKVVAPQNADSPTPATTAPSPSGSEEAGQTSATCSNESSEMSDPLSSTKLEATANPTSETISRTSAKDVKHKENNGFTTVELKSSLSPLLKAAQTGDVLGVKLSLRGFPTPKEVGEALLITNSPSVVMLLGRIYPEVIRGSEGTKALFAAAELDQVALLCALLNAGTDPNSVNRNTLTPLHKAVTKDHVDCVQALLKNGADILATTSCSGWSPLHMAAMNGAIKCMAALIEAGANIEEEDKGGCTALHHAARWNQVQAVEWLLKRGACYWTKNNVGNTPLSLTSSALIFQLIKQQSMTKESSLPDEDSNDDVPLCKWLKVRKRASDSPAIFISHQS